MKDIRSYTREEKVKEMLNNINLITAQLMNNITQIGNPKFSLFSMSEISEFLLKSKFIDDVYFIVEKPLFEIDHGDGKVTTIKVGTYSPTKLEEIDDIILLNPNKHIIFYDLRRNDTTGDIGLRFALVDDIGKIREEKINNVLNDK